MSKKKIMAMAGALLAAGVIALVVDLLIDAGAFRTIEPHTPRGCSSVEGLPGGGEDLAMRPGGRQVFVSAADRRDVGGGKGGIYLLDLDRIEDGFRRVSPELDHPLMPHGIDVWSDGERERLFVVNHPNSSPTEGAQGPHYIEVFDVEEGGTLVHVETSKSRLLRSPNDVAAVGPDAFYVTNDHGSSGTGLMRILEDYGRLPLGDVVHRTGDDEYRVVWDGTIYANGIAATDDGSTVYLAETTGLVVRRFERNPDDGTLKLRHTTELETGPDNLSIASDGSVWTGAHPKLLAFAAHAKDAEHRSPSQVVRLTPRDLEPETLYLNDGDPMSGSSAAVTDGRVFVVGSVFEPFVVVCPLEK